MYEGHLPLTAQLLTQLVTYLFCRSSHTTATYNAHENPHHADSSHMAIKTVRLVLWLRQNCMFTGIDASFLACTRTRFHTLDFSVCHTGEIEDISVPTRDNELYALETFASVIGACFIIWQVRHGRLCRFRKEALISRQPCRVSRRSSGTRESTVRFQRPDDRAGPVFSETRESTRETWASVRGTSG